MSLNEFDNRSVRWAGSRKLPVLKVNEFGKEIPVVAQRLQPVSKFGNVLFFYRLAAISADQGEVQFDKPYCVAVIA